MVKALKKNDRILDRVNNRKGTITETAALNSRRHSRGFLRIDWDNDLLTIFIRCGTIRA
jgi:hypothetical protein